MAEENLTEEQKKYRAEYDAMVTEAQDSLNQPQIKKESKEIKEVKTAKAEKKWEHLAVRPETFEEFRIMRGDDYKSDDAFVIKLIQTWKNYLNQNK